MQVVFVFQGVSPGRQTERLAGLDHNKITFQHIPPVAFTLLHSGLLGAVRETARLERHGAGRGSVFGKKHPLEHISKPLPKNVPYADGGMWARQLVIGLILRGGGAESVELVVIAPAGLVGQAMYAGSLALHSVLLFVPLALYSVRRDHKLLAAIFPFFAQSFGLTAFVAGF